MISKRKTTTAFALSLTFAMALTCFAEERIVKFRRADTPAQTDAYPVVTISNAASKTISGADDPNTFIRENTFTVYTTEEVYTKKEVEAFIKPLRDSVSQDEKELKTLNADIKTLSDTNDALTRRLNEVEAQMKKEHNPQQ
jgi:hypothetical protein